MTKSHEVRKPQQKRSIEKKEKILKAAYKLFCEKSYYKTSTPEIAAQAEVSIGCLYSYFQDKHTIFMEIYNRCLNNFDKIRDEFVEKLNDYDDLEKWLRSFIEMLIKAHEQIGPFMAEIHTLKELDPEVASKSNLQDDKIKKMALECLKKTAHKINIDDIEAGSVVIAVFTNALVDQIALNDNPIDKNRVLNEGITALKRYVLG